MNWGAIALVKLTLNLSHPHLFTQSIGLAPVSGMDPIKKCGSSYMGMGNHCE